MRVLLIEDDAMIGESVARALRAERFTVDWVRDGRAAELALAASPYDVALLDLGLPRKDGVAVLTQLRAAGDTLPVLVITARDAVPDRVRVLNAGADDYLVKPFDLDELTARVHALLRRRAGRAQTLIRHGSLAVDPLTREVSLAGKPVALSPREYSLLLALLDRPKAVLSVSQLQERVYGFDDEPGSNTIEVHVHALRRKLGSAMIRNQRGVGYSIGDPPGDAE